MSDGGSRGLEPRPLMKTKHFVERQRKRSIPDRWVLWALSYGVRFYQGTQCAFFLGRKQLRRLQRLEGFSVSEREMEQADGTVVIVGTGNALVTTYRNPTYIRYLKRCA